MRRAARALGAHLASAGTDLLRGLERVLDGRAARLLLVAAGLAAGWWIYVPLHELFHAWGCLAAGGRVSRLEIDPLYGGALLSRIVPFVVSGGAYAGRLSGFDTRGSDLVYFATDCAPYLLTLFPGVWALRRAALRASPLFFGAALSWAYAPWIAVTGDAYEIGSLGAVHLPPWSGEPGARALLVGDDVALRWEALAKAGPGAPWGGLATALLVGIGWAAAIWCLASWLSSRLAAPPLESAARPAAAEAIR